MNPLSAAERLTEADAQAVLQTSFARLEALRGQHLFLSGGTGILGSWILELVKVLNERHQFDLRVTVLSRHAQSFVERHPRLANQNGVHCVEGDVRYFSEIPPDTTHVIHAAALTDRRLIASQPTAVAEVNGIGTLRILRAAGLLENLHKFVLLSSGLIYGAQPWEMPAIDEGFSGVLSCSGVNSIYAESKRFAEGLAHGAVSELKLPIVTLRPFAFIGPYQSIELPWAVTDFIRDSFNGGPIRMMGDGTTVRSIMYASDYAFWVLAALANAKPRSVYNVGSPQPMDLATLARMITHCFTPTPEIRVRLGQKGHERTRLVPCVDRAIRDLGVGVTVSLEQSIQRTIAWHRYIQAQ